jgi:hypothetical protein
MPYKRFSLPRDTFLVTQFRQFLPLKGLFQQPLAIAQVIPRSSGFSLPLHWGVEIDQISVGITKIERAGSPTEYCSAA